jgi:branched-chain amino acid transport system ATP-binding protein
MLVDEPALGLAPQVVDQVYRTLIALRENGLTLVLVEQSLERAVAFADRLHVMREGTIKLSCTRTELHEKKRLEEAYFGFVQTNAANS